MLISLEQMGGSIAEETHFYIDYNIIMAQGFPILNSILEILLVTS